MPDSDRLDEGKVCATYLYRACRSRSAAVCGLNPSCRPAIVRGAHRLLQVKHKRGAEVAYVSIGDGMDWWCSDQGRMEGRRADIKVSTGETDSRGGGG